MDRLLQGAELVARDGTRVSAASLESVGVVGIYFTALWCPPCRRLTPLAAEVYAKAKLLGRSFEIVQVSSDATESTFEEYRSTVPWLALPFEERGLKERLCKKYRVSGVPMLILVDGKTGKLIARDGRSVITNDAERSLNDASWAPPAPISALGDTLVRGDGTEVPASVLGGKFAAIYFSASWCKPCQSFTPKLTQAYKRIKQVREDFEVVHVSLDRDQKEFDEQAGAMPAWLSMPFETARARGSALTAEFGVEEIPHVVMLGPQGHIINKDIVAHVAESVEAFPWRRKAVRDIAEAGGGLLNKTPAIIVFGDEGGALDAPAREAMERVEAHEDEEMVFCSAATSKEGSLGWKVRKLCGLADVGQAQMVLLDIPDSAFYTYEGASVTERSVREFMEAYKAGELTRVQLGPSFESG